LKLIDAHWVYVLKKKLLKKKLKLLKDFGVILKVGHQVKYQLKEKMFMLNLDGI
jgi:hypothetical protein